MGRDEYEEFRLRVQADLEDHDVRVRPRGRTETHVPLLPKSTSRDSMPSVVRGAIYFSPAWIAEYVNLEDFGLVYGAFSIDFQERLRRTESCRTAVGGL